MQNHQLVEVDYHKPLVYVFSNDCTWHYHIDHIKEKAWFRINVMRKLKFRLDRKSLETIYIAFIRPLLEYDDVIWDNCTQYEKLELDKTQNEATKIVTGAIKLISINALYNEIQWDTLEKRSGDHRLTLFYKMQCNITPTYLTSLVPRPVSIILRYNLRNSDDLQIIDSTQYYNSFLPSTVRSWNN